MTKKESETLVSKEPEAPTLIKGIKEMAKEKLEKMMKEECRTVKGVFHCIETPGSNVKIIVKKFPGIPHFEKIMEDGKTYEIPLYVARHLNGHDITSNAFHGGKDRDTFIGTCSYPIHGFKMEGRHSELKPGYQAGETVLPIVAIVNRKRRYEFQTMDFLNQEAMGQ